MFCSRPVNVSSDFMFVWVSFVFIFRMVFISIYWITAAVLTFVFSMKSTIVLEEGSWWFSVVVIVLAVVTTAVIKIVVVRFPVVGILRVDEGEFA